MYKKHSRRDKGSNVQLSKRLSLILRHKALEFKIQISPAGWCLLSDILDLQQFKGINQSQIESIVQSDEKKRYQMKEEHGKVYIRAVQGHSIPTVTEEESLQKLDIEFVKQNDWKAIHGTYKRFLSSILQQGLKPMTRKHVHFAPGLPKEKQVISGMRSSCEVFIEIDIELASLEGVQFYISQNNVILTPSIVAPKYFKKVIVDSNEIDISRYQAENLTNAVKYKQGNLVIPSEFYQFDYYFVLDFEANCVNKGNLICQEIIEFPVIVVSKKNLQVVNYFHKYVKTKVHPQISQFCTELTGITQQQVDNGILLQQVLEEFQGFIDGNQEYQDPKN